MIGGSHGPNFTFWGEGQIASDALRQVAEWGSVGALEQDLRVKVSIIYIECKRLKSKTKMSKRDNLFKH